MLSSMNPLFPFNTALLHSYLHHPLYLLPYRYSLFFLHLSLMYLPPHLHLLHHTILHLLLHTPLLHYHHQLHLIQHKSYPPPLPLLFNLLLGSHTLSHPPLHLHMPFLFLLPPINIHPMITRSKHGIYKPKVYLSASPSLGHDPYFELATYK